MGVTRVRVLGELAVVTSSGDVALLPRGLPRQLVGYLAVHRRPVPRREIVEHLWPDVDEESGLRRLRTALWEVQRVLVDDAGPVVDSARTTLAVNPGVAVDLDEAETLLRSGAVEAAVHLLDPGLSAELDQEWALPARRRAETLLRDALERLVDESTDPHVALGYARRRVELDGLSESAHQNLIECLARSGDRGGAFAAYAGMRDVLGRELGTSPSVESRQLLAQLAEGAAPVRKRSTRPGEAPRQRGRVPLPPTPMVGRDRDLTQVTTRLRDHRLVTIVGLGGLGKSRLAVAVAETLHVDGPVVFVELAATRQPETCAYVVAAQLGVVAGPDRTIVSAIADFLEAEPGLLVLDNCEHVRQSVAPIVIEVMTRCRGTRILATSRERLAVPGEVVVPLAPLAVPAAEEWEAGTLKSPSVRLLIDTATRRGAPQEALQDVAALRDLARRLDGIPLALELAGGRLATFEAAGLTETLQRGLSLLSATRSASSGNGRHDSLERTFDWSLSTLAPGDRRLMRLMAICPGRLPIQLVETLSHALSPDSDPAPALARLVEAGLVSATPRPRWSYSMLEPVRLHAEEKLTHADRDIADGALVRWATAFGLETERLLHVDEPAACVDFELYFPLIRQAVYTARARGDADAERCIVVSVEGWATFRERMEVGDWVLELATGPCRDDADAEVYRMAALASWRRGRMEEMRRLTDRCVHVDTRGWSTAHARTMLAWAERRWADVAAVPPRPGTLPDEDPAINLGLRSGALVHLGDLEAAVDLARRARTHADRTGNPTERAMSMLALGRAYARRHEGGGGGPDPEPVLVEGRRLSASVGSRNIEATLCMELARRQMFTGRPADAIEPLTSACEHWLVAGHREFADGAARRLARALAETGRVPAATTLTDLVGGDRLTLRTLREALITTSPAP